MGAALTLAACFTAAAVLHPGRRAPKHSVSSIRDGIPAQCCTRWMHWQSGASLGADIPMTASCTNRAKLLFLSKSGSRESYVSKSRVLKIWNLHVRSAARDLYQSSHTHQADKSCQSQHMITYSITCSIHSRSSGKLEDIKNWTGNTQPSIGINGCTNSWVCGFGFSICKDSKAVY